VPKFPSPKKALTDWARAEDHTLRLEDAFGAELKYSRIVRRTHLQEAICGVSAERVIGVAQVGRR